MIQEKKIFQRIFQPSVCSFLILGQTKAFSEAGKILGISQSAVSKNVTNLEEDLGMRLIDRSTRPIRLTRKGKALHDYLIRDILSLNNFYLNLTNDFLRNVTLNIGCIESFMHHVTRPLIEHYSDKLVSCKVLRGVSPRLLKDFDNDDIDIFISALPFYERSDLHRIFLYSEPTVLIVPKCTSKPISSWEELKQSNLPLLLGTQSSTDGKLSRNYLNKLRFRFNGRVSVDDYATTFDLIANGFGWTLQTPLTLSSFSQYLDKVQILPMPSPVSSRDFFVITRTNEECIRMAKDVSKVLSEIVLKTVVPKSLAIAPWIRTHLQIYDDSGVERHKIFNAPKLISAQTRGRF